MDVLAFIASIDPTKLAADAFWLVSTCTLATKVAEKGLAWSITKLVDAGVEAKKTESTLDDQVIAYLTAEATKLQRLFQAIAALFSVVLQLCEPLSLIKAKAKK